MRLSWFFLIFLWVTPIASWATLSTGTGFYITSTGYIATNHHVVEGANSIAVRDFRGQSYPAKLIRTDAANDLAILKVEGNFSALPLTSSSTVRRGDSVFTLGFPNTGLQGLSVKLTDGVVSSTSGLRDEPNNFQISVPIQPGNSGGPLINREGAVIGLVVAKLSATAALRSGSTLPELVNYAVKSNYLLELIATDLNLSEQVRVTQRSGREQALASLVTKAESSVVLIIAETATKEKNSPPKATQQPRPQPPDASGNQPAIRDNSIPPQPAQLPRPQPPDAATGQPPIRIKLGTSMGEILLELYPDQAPKTVENFVQYVKDKHYDGTIFHRVIENFMVQGGGFDASYVQKKTRPPVIHEGREALAKGGSRNVVGTVAMARTNDPQSASSQFFINVKDNAFLDPVVIPPGDPVPKFEYQGRVYENTPRAALMSAPQLFGYTVFGKVIAGMDVVNKIKATPTGAGGPFPTDVPKTPILINKATLEN